MKIKITSFEVSRASSVTSGKYFPGFSSSYSKKIPSLVILPSAWRSAEQLTPKPTGQLAP